LESIKKTYSHNVKDDRDQCFPHDLISIDELINSGQKNALPISIFSNYQEKSIRNLTTSENALFIWYQLLIDVLLRIPTSNQNAKIDLIKFSREYYEGNEKEQEKINEFDQYYQSKKAIFWYTRDCFLFRLLNQAFRTEDIDNIFKFRFFIVDLYQQLLDLHSSQHFPSKLTVYRGQSIGLTELEHLKANIGQLISMNTFLSTTTDPGVASIFAGDGTNHPSYERSVLFEMTIDTTRCHKFKPFADISQHSYMKDENEILLLMGSIFRISSVEIENNVWIIKLIFTEQEDKQIIQLTDYQKTLLREKETVVLLGRHLQDMGENEKAKHYYNLILKDLPEDSMDVSSVYNNLGAMASNEYKNEEALNAYEKSLNINKKILSEIHPYIAASYNNIATIYGRMGDTQKAIDYYEKALRILFQLLQTNRQPTTLPQIAEISNNLGVLSGRNGNHECALWYFKKTLEFQLLFLPVVHPTYAITFFNIGDCFEQVGNREQAMIFYEKSLEICNKSLPANHPQTATTLSNIGGLYYKASNWPSAIKYLEKALEINRHILPKNHSDLIRSYNNLASIYHCLGKDDLAIDMFESVLSSTTISDSPSFDTAHTYSNCGAVYFKQGNYTKALENFTKAYELALKLHPFEQSRLTMYQENVENTKRKLDQITVTFE
jgi:tetratricopeptide (TPR) repeat protein